MLKWALYYTTLFTHNHNQEVKNDPNGYVTVFFKKREHLANTT